MGQRSIALLSQQKRQLERQVEEVARKTAPEAYLTDIHVEKFFLMYLDNLTERLF